MPKVLTLFGTRPEVIKLGPVISELDGRSGRLESVNVASSQHTDLLRPFVRFFRIRVRYDLDVMRPDQQPSEVVARVLDALDPILCAEAPDLLLVQGDTTTTLAGSLAGFHRSIPVAHVEAGLRTEDPRIPFPEEMNRRLVTRLAALHFAATEHNVRTLVAEGVPPERVVRTGNPVVDALNRVLESAAPSPELAPLLERHRRQRLLVLTTHRRESFGKALLANLRVIRHFVERHADVAVVFPVHPNPAIRQVAHEWLAGSSRIELIDPLEYPAFLELLSRAWLVVSDSGGVQEEAPTLGKPLLVLRSNTERPEAIWAGVAKLVGGSPERLGQLLEETYADETWIKTVAAIPNPFGAGDAAPRIVDAIEAFLRDRSV